MSVIAVAVKHLIAAGVTGDALVNAIADMEESTSPQKSATVTPSAIRMRRYREHRKANGMNPSTPEYLSHVDAVKERDFHMCVYCGSDENIVIDHMIPVCQGGTDDPDNLAAACRSCNAGKSGKTPEQWGRKIQSKAAHVALLRYVARNGYASPSPLVPPLSPAPLSPPIIPPTRNDNTREASDQAVSEWNDVASELGLPKVQRLTDVRRKKLAARLRDCGGIDGWRAAMAKIRGSPLCRGELGDWRADFDFVLQESSFVKLMEGKYDGRQPGTGPKASKRSSLDDTFAKIDACFDEAERREVAAFSETG